MSKRPAKRTPPPPDPRRPTPVYRRPKFDFSVIGLMYALVMAFLGLAAMNVQASLLFAVFGLMVGVLLISGVISKMVLRRLRVRRVLPDQATVGRVATIRYAVTNARRLIASFGVTISELDGVQSFRRQPMAYLLHVAPGQTSTVVAEAVPRRRGFARLDRFQLASSFPFGFVKRAATRRREDAMLVFPPMAQVDPKLLSALRSAEIAGQTLRPKPRGHDEFYGLREYRPGESPRLIDWKRTARTGRLVSREMTQVSPPRIVVVVDTHNPDGGDARAAEVERSIAQAASLVDLALDSGLAVGLVVRSAGQWTSVPASRGKRHKLDLLTALALLPDAREQRSVDAGEAVAHASPLANQSTTIVLFTGTAAGVAAPGGPRRRVLAIAAEGEQARGWFEFDASIDFATVGPDIITPRRQDWRERLRRSFSRHQSWRGGRPAPGGVAAAREEAGQAEDAEFAARP